MIIFLMVAVSLVIVGLLKISIASIVVIIAARYSARWTNDRRCECKGACWALWA